MLTIRLLSTAVLLAGLAVPAVAQEFAPHRAVYSVVTLEKGKPGDGVPGTYAMQAYDTAMLIDSAVKAVKGDLSNKEAVSAALKKADFTSLRGGFKFNTNGYPIQNFYLTKVAKRPDGKFQTEIVEKVFSDYGDSYAKDCKPQ
jgi:ABC-type branched-subunit amino acid transport system substrate-binding protein